MYSLFYCELIIFMFNRFSFVLLSASCISITALNAAIEVQSNQAASGESAAAEYSKEATIGKPGAESGGGISSQQSGKKNSLKGLQLGILIDSSRYETKEQFFSTRHIGYGINARYLFENNRLTPIVELSVSMSPKLGIQGTKKITTQEQLKVDASVGAGYWATKKLMTFVMSGVTYTKLKVSDKPGTSTFVFRRESGKFSSLSPVVTAGLTARATKNGFLNVSAGMQFTQTFKGEKDRKLKMKPSARFQMSYTYRLG
jgi:opacity protein-like surface antigen